MNSQTQLQKGDNVFLTPNHKHGSKIRYAAVILDQSPQGDSFTLAAQMPDHGGRTSWYIFSDVRRDSLGPEPPVRASRADSAQRGVACYYLTPDSRGRELWVPGVILNRMEIHSRRTDGTWTSRPVYRIAHPEHSAAGPWTIASNVEASYVQFPE